jgi:hypothetical protein
MEVVHVQHLAKDEYEGFGAILGSNEEQNKPTSNVWPMGEMEQWESVKRAVKAEIASEWAQSSRESMWKWSAAMGDGARWQKSKCDVCTKNERGGNGLERQSEWGLQRRRTCLRKK